MQMKKLYFIIQQKNLMVYQVESLIYLIINNVYIWFIYGLYMVYKKN